MWFLVAEQIMINSIFIHLIIIKTLFIKIKKIEKRNKYLFLYPIAKSTCYDENNKLEMKTLDGYYNSLFTHLTMIIENKLVEYANLRNKSDYLYISSSVIKLCSRLIEVKYYHYNNTRNYIISLSTNCILISIP